MPHFIIIISKTLDGKALLVPISSIKPDKYYDKSCILGVDDIIDENGKKVLTKPSYIRYEKAYEISIDIVINKAFDKIYDHKCRISDRLLARIQNYASNNKKLTNKKRGRGIFAFLKRQAQ